MYTKFFFQKIKLNIFVLSPTGGTWLSFSEIIVRLGQRKRPGSSAIISLPDDWIEHNQAIDDR